MNFILKWNRIRISVLLFSVLLLTFAGCNSKVGIDSLSVEENEENPKSIELSCAACHGSGKAVDPLDSGKHTRHVAERGYSCTTCHFDYVGTSFHMDGNLDTGSYPGEQVMFNAMNIEGNWNPETGSCSSISCHGTDTVSWYDKDAEWTVPSDCASCHSSGSAEDPLDAGTHIRHVAEMDYSCSKCHFEYENSNSHIDGNLDAGSLLVDVVVFDQMNPDGVWTVDSGTGTGGCSTTACHGADTVEWYDNTGDGWTTPTDCVACHSSATATRRQVMGPGGDFDKESHHVIDYSNRTTEIIKSNDCLVCHDQSSHMGGTVLLKDKDTSVPVVYDPANPASLEVFCLSCHDSDGAVSEGVNSMSPFTSGNTLGIIPNSAGSEIKSSWNSSKAEHREEGLTCFGSGDPATGCHGNGGQVNAHGSSSYGLLTKNMNFQIPGSAAYNETDYELCFSCHASESGISKESVLGVKQGGNYDYNLAINPRMGPSIVFGTPPYYNSKLKIDFVDSDAHIHGSTRSQYKYQLHWFHLSMRIRTDSDIWLYRGEGTPLTSCNGCHSSEPIEGNKASCITCHNVHGSNSSVGMVYDELNITHNENGTAGFLGSDKNTLSAAPVYCGTSECHSSVISENNYIFDPSGE